MERNAKLNQALDNLKYEVARELGIDYEHADKGDMPARLHGHVGGNMTRKLVEMAERSIGKQ